MDTAPSANPIAYMERTRRYYRALGYEADYVWSHYNQVPFAALAQPLSTSRITLISTVAPLGHSNRDERGRKRVWSATTSPPPDGLVTDHVAWDKESTHTNDRESYLPIAALESLAEEGTIASPTSHFIGVPTEYSQRKTIEIDAPDVLERVVADGSDAAILCPL